MMTTRGIKFSEEVRERRSKIFKKLYTSGKIVPFWSGKKLSEEHRKRISESSLGKIIPPEVRKKISEYWTGRKRPWLSGENNPAKRPEVREKIRLSKIGEKNGMYGRRYKMPEYVKKKLSIANKGQVSWSKGKKRPDVSEMLKRLWKEEKYRELFTKKALRRRIPTSFENKVLEVIQKNNLPYKYVGDGKFWIGKYNPDFININGEKKAVEVFYSFHKLRHYKSIEEFMAARTRKFSEYGWRVIFIDENELKEEIILKKINEICGGDIIGVRA